MPQKIKKTKPSKTPAIKVAVEKENCVPSQQSEVLNATNRQDQEATLMMNRIVEELDELRRKMVAGTADWKGIKDFIHRIPIAAHPFLRHKIPEVFDLDQFPQYIQSLELGESLKAGLSSPQLDELCVFADRLFKKTGLNPLQIPDAVAAMFQIRRELSGGPETDAKILAAYDQFLLGKLRIDGGLGELSEHLAERLKLADIRGERYFIAKVGHELMTEPVLPENFDLCDFHYGDIQKFLLANWECIEGWKPELGLRQFSKEGLRAYCEARLNDKKKHPINEDAVEKSRKRLKLDRLLPPLVKGADPDLDPGGNPLTGRIILQLKKGGQIIHQRCTPHRDCSKRH